MTKEKVVLSKRVRDDFERRNFLQISLRNFFYIAPESSTAAAAPAAADGGCVVEQSSGEKN